MNTSIGFHTITMSNSLTWQGLNEILKDFQNYSNKTKSIKIQASTVTKTITLPDGTIREVKPYYEIEFLQKYTGINKWVLRFCNFSEKYQCYLLEVTINPKILAGIKDCVSASTLSHWGRIEIEYGKICAGISDKLPPLSFYKPKRIDYCINFDLSELGYNCTTYQMMKLIRKGDIPHYFKERQPSYSQTSHRWKTDKHSFYLTTDSVVINIYEKQKQLKIKDPNNPGFKASESVIRFEIQCKYPIINYLINTYIKPYDYSLERMNNPQRYNSMLIKMLLSDEICRRVIYSYFNKVINSGDYYTLESAIDKIESCHFRHPRAERLIATLKLVEEHKGISRAKEYLKNNEISAYDFNRSISELAEIGINPVTLPSGLRVKHLPGLMKAYECFFSCKRIEYGV